MRIFIFLTVLFSANLFAHNDNNHQAENSIRAVMAAQQAAWNTGNLTEFMAGYWQSDTLRFASGDSYRHGWQTTLDNYIKGYPDAATMGQLKFDIIDIEQLSDNAALVFGRWQLTRTKDQPQGLFTLVFRKFGKQWLITRDHTSSAK